MLARQPDFPRDKLGAAMNAFYGGRAESRIRRLPLPVAYTDFLSMYPTVNALLGNWAMLTASEIRVVDATEEVREFLRTVRLDDCFRPETWSHLTAFVKVRPGSEPFPCTRQVRPSWPELADWLEPAEKRRRAVVCPARRARR